MPADTPKPAGLLDPESPDVGDAQGNPADTRARIVGASIDVFRRLGYESARVDDVVRAAGVSHGTFYLYFRNKGELYRTTAAEVLLAAGSVVRRLDIVDGDAASVRCRLRDWLSEMAEVYRRFGPVLGGWLDGHSDDVVLNVMARDLTAELESRIERAFAAPAARAVGSPRQAAEVITAMVARSLDAAAASSPAETQAVIEPMTEILARVLTLSP